jgi:DNA-binding transcriptional MerR regulator
VARGDTGTFVDGRPTRVITIGQLAAYAGVTIKAVRHYHKRGLIEEPPRDSSGYRRYTAEDAIELIKIKTLAEAGVPLARIKELVATDPEHFATSISEIDRSLKKRAEELAQTRKRIAQLNGGDRLFVSAEVADFLDDMRELGVSERTLKMERAGWILMQSVSPKQAAIWMAEKRGALRDPQFLALYLEYDAAFDWSPDDPRLYALADRSQRWFADRSGKLEPRGQSMQDPTIAKLIAASSGVSSPAWDRLAEIARERMAGG